MADGTYERRGPREAELRRFQRLLAETRAGMTRAIVSLGSNVEPRRAMIERACAHLAALPQTRLAKTSAIVETDPVDVPAEFQHLKFLNCVAVLETALEPLDFSRRMHAIEDALGRVRSVRNGPRTIDLDLIDFGGLRMETEELTLPHPRAKMRAFVMEPLKALGLTLASLLLMLGPVRTARAGALDPATPESQGVSTQGILDWIDACEKTFDGGKAGALHGFVLLRHGKVIAEGSWKPFDTLNATHVLFSHSKSFTSTAIGFLVDDGKLDLDERVVDLFPDETPADAGENLRQMRVRDLLTMNHGEEKGHTIYGSGNWARNFLAKEYTCKPGQRMRYDSDATYMLAAIVAKKSGMDAWAFLKERLFDKIGISKAWTTRSPQGIPTGGSGMNMTTRELARFGQFYLQRGVWNGERLLSDEWVTLATARQTWCDGIHVQAQVRESGSDWRQGYGFQFWRCRFGAYRADGASGQLTVVMPAEDAVLSVHAGLSDMQGELNLVWKHLLPAMKSGALPEDPALQERLRARLANLAVAPVAGTRTGAAADRLGRTLTFERNGRGFETIRLDPTGEGWRCTLVTRSGRQEFPVGFGAWSRGRAAFDTDPYESIFNLPGSYEIAASGAFDAGGTLRVRFYPLGTRDRFAFALPPGEAPLTDGGSLRATERK